MSRSEAPSFLDSLSYSEFENFMLKYNKHYSASDLPKKFQTFQDNSSYIRKSNMKNSGFVLEINKFSDLTLEEFSEKYFSNSSPQGLQVKFEAVPPKFPSAIDWRTLGGVTAVKNQDPCSCGWAFASTGAVEGAWFASGHSLVSLSEQQLLDCSGPLGNNGCNGGFVENSLEYTISFGLASESVYPYTGYPTLCQSDLASQVSAKISHYVHLPTNNLTQLVSGVAISPVSVNVWGNSWVNYKSGILTDTCVIEKTNFSAVVVGYNLNATVPYLIVKSSWGTDWGVNGYIYVKAVDGKGTSCINQNPILAIV